MSKRPPSHLETPRKKRSGVKLANQPRLDVFFSSPSQKNLSAAVTSGNSVLGKSDRGGTQSSHTLEIIDVDATEDIKAETATSSKSKAKLTIANSKLPFAVYTSLDVDPLLYTPSSQPLAGSSIPYSFLAHGFVSLSQTRSRIQILNIITNMLRTVIHFHPSSLLPSLYLLSNSLAPPYTPVELNLGSSIISRAIQSISGLSPTALKHLYNTTGDPGDVAFEAKNNIRTLIPHPALLVTFVYENLLRIAECRGQGAAKQKERIVERLLVAASGEEVRYITRTLCQNLRVGAVRTTILTALARSMVLTPLSRLGIPEPGGSLHVTTELLIHIHDQGVMQQERPHLMDKYVDAERLVKQVFVQHPNYDHIVSALLRAGLTGLSELVPLTVGIPLHPTLGSPVRSLQEVYSLLGNLPFTAEYKYDGQRAQIHAWKAGTEIVVQIFSRHLEDMTTKYPDVVSLVENIFMERPHISSFIIDSEIVAVDALSGKLKSFQELSNRARKDVQLDDVRVSVCVFAFDLMYLNGDILLKKAFRERRHVLRSELPSFRPSIKGAAFFDHVRSCESHEGESAIQEFWREAIETRCEGIMVKLLESGEVTEPDEGKKAKSRRKALPATYEPDKRTASWLKLKKDYVTGIGDTLDLIPIGAWHGNGRKAQWWSPILLALWDPDRGHPIALCKCMSGFTDVFYKALAKCYSLTDDRDTCSSQSIWGCDLGGFRPDVYFKPQEVWEIRGADITISPVSTAASGLVNDTKGLSLRFPRFIRRREDKNIQDASTPLFLVNMWRSQQGVGSGGADDDILDVDFDVYSDELLESE